MLPLAFLSLVIFASSAARADTGDSFCSTLVCCSAVKSSSKVTYTLSRTPASQISDPGFGWISIGWGTTMANSPMVIVWPNQDTSITLSQRSSRAQIQPTETTPSSVATLETYASFVNSSATSITFSFDDYTAPGVVPIIWAYSNTNPGSPSPAANIAQHRDSGATTLDLTKVLTSSTTTTRAVNSTQTASVLQTASQATGKPVATTTNLTAPQATRVVGGSSSPTSDEPYTSLQRIIIAHATFGGLGAMVLIPTGVVIARLLRAFWPHWITAHWLVHVVLSLPFIAIAFGLGIHATNLSTGMTSDHFWSSHRALGLSVFILIIFQIGFGSAIHLRPASHHSKAQIKGKSIQNWLHPVVGVLILVIGWATVWSGFDEWASSSGLGSVPKGVRVAWGVLLGIFALAYLLGLSLLPKQFRQQKADGLRSRESREMVLVKGATRSRDPSDYSSAPMVISSPIMEDRKNAAGVWDSEHDENGLHRYEDERRHPPFSFQEDEEELQRRSKKEEGEGKEVGMAF
ncbi:hypothetical protein BDY24DRAFT_378185 [Mrakia frigida]|uniref:cytochrome and DOMON domain-containing protein n=1 Tax=Mrakia frigida TaxID=29902 RepID=UPI003FCC11EE